MVAGLATEVEKRFGVHNREQTLVNVEWYCRAVAPNDMAGRLRVYVMIRRSNNTMYRVLDLAYFGDQPIAVVSWVLRDGRLVPGRHIKLEREQLWPAAPKGTFQYDGIVDEPF